MSGKPAARRKARDAVDTETIDGRSAARMRNREALLAAAHALFSASGYEAVTIRDIVAAAKVGLGTFYNHFDDKEEIFRVLVDSYAAQEIRRQRADRLKATTFPEFIERHFRYFFQSVCQYPEQFQMFQRNAVVIREMLDSPTYVQGQKDLRRDIEALIRKGLLHPIDAEFAEAAIMALCIDIGAIMVRRTPSDPEAATQFATQLIIGGLPWR